MNLRNFLGVMTVMGLSVSLGFSILFFFTGEFEKATPLALYAIVSLLINSEI